MAEVKGFMAVDAEKLREELKKRNVTMADASREAGFDKGYIKNMIKNGHLRKAVVDSLKWNYGITYDLIEPAVKVEAEIVSEPVATDNSDVVKTMNEILLALYDLCKIETENQKYLMSIAKALE